MPEISAVFLDAGDTLLAADPPIDHVYRAAFARHGVEATADDVHGAVHVVGRRLHTVPRECGAIDVVDRRVRGEKRVSRVQEDRADLRHAPAGPRACRIAASRHHLPAIEHEGLARHVPRLG